MRHLLPISALLLSSAFLLFAGGINGLILPVRGSDEGFSSFALGLLGTGWAIGYVLGCLYTPVLVARVGHIRSFSVMAAGAALAILLSLLMLSPIAWIPLRAISGFCFAGAAMIVESWLNEQVEPSSRGRVFGIYTMVNLVASTGGQIALTVGDTTGYLFFAWGAIFYCLAIIPTAVTSSTTPQPLTSVRLDIRTLWRNSPIAVFGVLMVGISNSAFGTLSAVYADQVGLVMPMIAFFASLPILAGAIAQIPVGILSDLVDRRLVLVGIAIFAITTDLAFLILLPQEPLMNVAIACLFGAAVFSMYPVIVAHACDHAAPGTFLQISGGLLMVYGVGCIFGPLFAGWAMSAGGPSGLFATTLASHVCLVLYAIWRIMARPSVEATEKVDFVPAPMARASTPETINLATDELQEAESEA
ncbi:MFS transporter [Rhodobacteraceae bacterium NNCM2]|nr:MFS transporter [Coraliihabitans acroporae]